MNRSVRAVRGVTVTEVMIALLLLGILLSLVSGVMGGMDRIFRGAVSRVDPREEAHLALCLLRQELGSAQDFMISTVEGRIWYRGTRGEGSVVMDPGRRSLCLVPAGGGPSRELLAGQVDFMGIDQPAMGLISLTLSVRVAEADTVPLTLLEDIYVPAVATSDPLEYF